MAAPIPVADSSPLYLDWTFWAFVVAAIALILSQLPPLKTLFRRSRLTLHAHGQIAVGHHLGNAIVQLHLVLSNQGPRPIRVQSIELEIRRNDRDVMRLPANGYYETSNAKEALILTPFVIVPDGDWSHIANCFAYLPQDEERQVQNLKEALRQNIQARRAGLPADHPDVEADVALVQTAQTVFDGHFPWRQGEYDVTVSVSLSSDKSPLQRHFRFTLYESDIESLRSITQGYRYGLGVILPVRRGDSILVQLKPT